MKSSARAALALPAILAMTCIPCVAGPAPVPASAAIATSIPIPPPAPAVAAASRTMQQETKAWVFTWRYPQLEAPGALMGVRGALGDVNLVLRAQGERALAAFKRDVAELESPGTELEGAKHTLDATYSIQHLPVLGGGARQRTDEAPGDDLLSVTWEVYRMMAGAAHPYTEVVALNLLSGGKVLRLRDLFLPGQGGLDTLSRLALEHLRKQGARRGFIISCPAGAAAKEECFEDFVPKREGLRVYFQRGQVTAGVVGNLEVTIPWRDLRSLSPLAVALARSL